MALVKAGKNDGIYKNDLKNGDTAFYYTYKDLNKKIHRIKVGLKSQGVNATYAKNKRDEAINLMRSGGDPSSHKKKSVEFADIWDFYIKNKKLGEATKKDREGRYTKHMEAYFAKHVSVDDLKRFRNDKKDVLSPSSIDMLIAFVGTAITFWNAKKKQNLHNPVKELRDEDRVDGFSVQKVNRKRFLTHEEIATLKEAVADKPELNLFVHLSLSTGGRLATIMSIKKMDIRNGNVTMTNFKRKNKEGKDYIYHGHIEPKTQVLLDERWSKLKNGDTVVQLEQRQVQRRLQWIMNKLFNEGLESKDPTNRVMVHTLRHTFASHLVMNGVDLLRVSKLLDHKDVSITQIYAHLAPDAGKKDVMELWS